MIKDRTGTGAPADLNHNAILSVADALNSALADCFALHIKTKNFHWHVSGPHFRDYHLMLDEQAAQILGIPKPVPRHVIIVAEDDDIVIAYDPDPDGDFALIFKSASEFAVSPIRGEAVDCFMSREAGRLPKAVMLDVRFEA